MHFQGKAKNSLPPRMRHKFKLRNPKSEQSTIQLDQQIQLMANNLLKVQRQLTEEDQEEISDHNHVTNQRTSLHVDRDQFYEHIEKQRQPVQFVQPTQITNQETDQVQQGKQYCEDDVLTQLKQRYQDYLQQNKFSQNYEQKINQLLDSEQNLISVGTAIALYEMVFYFKQILTKEVLFEIQMKSFKSFVNICKSQQQSQSQNHTSLKNTLKDKQNQLLKLCLSELIAICGIAQQSILQFFVQNMFQNPSSFDLSFKVMVNLGFQGICTLIKLSTEDFEEISTKTIGNLSRSEFVIHQILVPQLIYDLTNLRASSNEKTTALMILNKLGQFVYSEELVEVLVSLLKSNVIDKNLLISTISSVGKQLGQKILIDLLRSPGLNEDIAVFTIKCLTQKQQTNLNKLTITVSQYPTTDIFQMNKLYFYEGHAKSFSVEKTHCDTLYINSRMFSSLLENFIIQFQSNEQDFSAESFPTQLKKQFVLSKTITKNEEDQTNLQVIEVLSQLIDKSNKPIKLKEASIEAFGQIQLPQNSQQILQKLFSCLYSNDASILTSTCVTLSKMNFMPSLKVIQRFTELLKNNFWKVRISSCQAIAKLVRQPHQMLLETLIKCLKDGSINRELVCQTLLKIHPICEQILINFLNGSKDFKIQQTILCSFNDSQLLTSPNFPSILETVFKFSTHQKKELRYICIGVVNCLRKYSIENNIEVSYFKPKNALPFYYNYLNDPCAEIRNLALNFILEFGSHAQLVLIEGMTKGKVNCKIQCAKGLGFRGVQNFRALLLGIRDINEKVRKQCCESIMQNFSIEEIVLEYKDNSSQCISLIYNLKDLLEGNFFFDSQIKVFMEELIEKLAQDLMEDQECQNEQIQIEKEINQFRQNNWIAKQNQKIHTDVQRLENEDIENMDPNIKSPSQNQKQNLSQCKIQKPKDVRRTQHEKRSQGKRYYFKLNQSIS